MVDIANVGAFALGQSLGIRILVSATPDLEEALKRFQIYGVIVGGNATVVHVVFELLPQTRHRAQSLGLASVNAPLRRLSICPFRATASGFHHV